MTREQAMIKEYQQNMRKIQFKARECMDRRFSLQELLDELIGIIKVTKTDVVRKIETMYEEAEAAQNDDL